MTIAVASPEAIARAPRVPRDQTLLFEIDLRTLGDIKSSAGVQ